MTELGIRTVIGTLAFVVGFFIAYVLNEKPLSLWPNLDDCLDRGGTYALSVSPVDEWLFGTNYEFCRIEQRIDY